MFQGNVLGVGGADEWRRYSVTSSLIDWAHAKLINGIA